jgi:hypothetical protein
MTLEAEWILERAAHLVQDTKLQLSSLAAKSALQARRYWFLYTFQLPANCPQLPSIPVGVATP